MDTKERIQAVFNSIEKMSSLWKFIGVCYIEDGWHKNDFVITGSDDISYSLSNIEGKIIHYTPWQPEKHVEEFVNVAKILLFEAQGHSQAPLNDGTQIDKICKEIDQASAPENIFFWTPEQLSILQAIDKNHMLLMGYYGTGKTVLLIERAEHLLRQDPDNLVYFLIDQKNTSKEWINGLEESLKLRFNGRKTIIVESKVEILTQEFLQNSSFKKSDHLIIDEVVVWRDDQVELIMEELKTKVASLWVAVGSITRDVEQFRRKAEDIGFICPTLEHCLRNASDIAEFSKHIEDNDAYGFNKDNLKKFINVKIKTMINQGILKRMPKWFPNPMEALKAALLETPKDKKCFIFIESKSHYLLSDFKNALPQYDFGTFEDEDDRQAWFSSSVSVENPKHLILQVGDGGHKKSYISGMEFDQMVSIYPACSKCGKEFFTSNIITRAKACLVMAKVEVQSCYDCQQREL